MAFEHPRAAPRYTFAVAIELTDLQSRAQIQGRTKDLSMCGCGVDAANSFPQGSSVKIKLSHEGVNVAALARVVYVSPVLGMGLAFTQVDPQDERILEEWIAELMSMTMQKQ